MSALTRRGLLRAVAAAPVAAALLPGAAHAGGGPDLGAGWRRELDAALDGIVDTGRDTPGKAASAIAMVTGAGGTWWGGSGFLDWTAGRPVAAHPDYQFRVGSITKTFTATMVLQLVDEGGLELDDPIGAHLPGLVPGEDRITVRHLLGMASGLLDYLRLLYPGAAMARHAEWSHIGAAPLAPRTLVAMAAEAGPQFEPGAHFDYCTTNYLLLGLLVERITGRGYRQELHRRIVRPLGLPKTDMPVGPGTHPLRLTGYGAFADRPERWVDITETHEHGWAGGALLSSRRDLSRFIAALLGGKLLRPATLAAMTTPLGLPPRPGFPGDDNYGLGLQRFRAPGRPTLWGHTGLTHGYRTSLMATPDGAGRFVVCQSGFPAPPLDLGQEMDRLLTAALAVLAQATR